MKVTWDSIRRRDERRQRFYLHTFDVGGKMYQHVCHGGNDLPESAEHVYLGEPHNTAEDAAKGAQFPDYSPTKRR